MRRQLLIVGIALFTSFYAKPLITPKQSQKGFVENKGQIHDQNFKANPTVKFLLNVPGMNVQLRSNGFSYDTYKNEKREIPSSNKGVRREETAQYVIDSKYHRIDIEFVNANSNAQVFAEERSSDYLNFYNSVTPESGATEVYHYGKVTYRNIYPNIDVEFISEPNGKISVEYNFILRPGANINNIQLKYKGANTIELKNGKLNINVSNGNLVEEIPVSFWKNSGKKEKINYTILSKNSDETIIGYSGIDKVIAETLIIDPTPVLNWGTYFGGDESCTYMTIDAASNVFIVGDSGFGSISTTGAYQTTITAGPDAYIAKFNSNGGIMWATYYGGNSMEECTRVCTDNSGNIFVTDYTNSSNVMASTGAYQTSLAGTRDCFLAKFNTSGFRIWGTFYGGIEYSEEQSFGICTDPIGNVFITGVTNSTSGIATSGAHQTSFSGSTAYDAFLAKFDANGNILWATYYGDNNNDGGQNVSCDKLGNVFLLGYSDSYYGIATPGAYQYTLATSVDAFIVKFNPSGTRLWGTYYGGYATEFLGDIKVDASNNAIICGYTNSGSNISTSGSWQPNNNGGTSDAYLAKFNSNGSLLWGTYYGGTNKDFGIGLATDSLNSVYLTGHTLSTTFISTPTAYQPSLASPGISDSFLAKFDSTGTRIWGTYYGGNAGDNAVAISVGKNGDIFNAGGSSSTNGIATSGAFQTTNMCTGYGVYVAKFYPTGTIGIVEFNINSDKDLVTIYPNPNNGEFFIKAKEEIKLEIVNELGQALRTVSLNQSNNYSSEVKDLKAGVYFINSTNRATQKIIVTK
jgi:hypothetical protein